MKLKDLFTLGNLLCGFAAVVALFHGAFEWSCYLIYIGYLFDVLDGPVARLTKQFDKFGGLFDSVCDYITNSISVSFIIYYAFWKNAGYPWIVAAVLGAFPFAFGTIRQAKGMEKDLSYPCYWIGLPRPVLAIFILAVLNSSLFNLTVHPWRELGHILAALFIVVGSVLHLTHIPFINHHDRRWMGALWFGVRVFLAGSPLAWLVGWLLLGWPGLVYNYVLFCMVIYIFLSWTQIPRADLERIRAYIAGGPLVKPLVHKDGTWRPRSLAPYYLADGRAESEPGPAASAGEARAVMPEAEASAPSLLVADRTEPAVGPVSAVDRHA